MYLQIAMNRILKKKSEKNQPKYVIMELFETFSDDYIECKHINDIFQLVKMFWKNNRNIVNMKLVVRKN